MKKKTPLKERFFPALIFHFYSTVALLPYKIQRNRRQADAPKNTTEARNRLETMLKVYKLLSEGKLQLCQSKCSSSPPGPPGPPGPRGEKGVRGRRGQKGRSGNKGERGIMGSPGKSGKQGIMGPEGPMGMAGPKGQKGDIGPAGMPGAKGEPGESISAPTIAVSPATSTVNETGSASFQCSVSGNPEPTIVWSKLGNPSKISPSSVLGGKLLLRNVKASDSGKYRCSAANILGQAQAQVQLTVNGKFVYFVSFPFVFCLFVFVFRFIFNPSTFYFPLYLNRLLTWTPKLLFFQ